MTYFKADDRKSNALLFLGMTCLVLTYFTMTANSQAARVVWTTFLILAGLSFVSLALIPRYKVSLNDNEVILESRFGLLSKRVPSRDIKQVKVLDKKYPVTLYRNTILHLLLWDKKFSRFKQIHLLGQQVLYVANHYSQSYKDYKNSLPNKFVLTITKFDTSNKIIAGIFNGVLYNRTNFADSVLIQDGRFDAQLDYS